MRSEAATSEPMKLPPTTSALRASGAASFTATASASVRKVCTAGRSAPGTGERPRPGAARDHERAVGDRLAACEL